MLKQIAKKTFQRPSAIDGGTSMMSYINNFHHTDETTIEDREDAEKRMLVES